MSLGIIVMHLVCIVQRLVSSNKHTKYTSAASCSAKTAPAWMWNPVYSSAQFHEPTSRMIISELGVQWTSEIF